MADTRTVSRLFFVYVDAQHGAAAVDRLHVRARLALVASQSCAYIWFLKYVFVNSVTPTHIEIFTERVADADARVRSEYDALSLAASPTRRHRRALRLERRRQRYGTVRRSSDVVSYRVRSIIIVAVLKNCLRVIALNDDDDDAVLRTAQLLAADLANAIRKPATGEHVDMCRHVFFFCLFRATSKLIFCVFSLGSNGFISDMLHLACGHRSELNDRVASNVRELSERLAERIGL